MDFPLIGKEEVHSTIANEIVDFALMLMESRISVAKKLFTRKGKCFTYLAMVSTNDCKESWNLAATVGVLGFMVTNRPLLLLIVLAASAVSLNS